MELILNRLNGLSIRRFCDLEKNVAIKINFYTIKLNKRG